MNPSTPAAPPVVDVSQAPLPPVSPWVGYCRAALIFTGVCYILLGALMVPLFFWVQGQEDADIAPVFGFLGFVMCAGFGALNFVAAHGLKQEARWGWILSLVLAAMYAPSACLPIGVVLLIGLFRDDVRSRFLGA